MAKFDCLNGDIEWIDLEFVERERTPQQAIEVGIQLHLAGLSLSNTKQKFERLGVERSRTTIHNWVQKADLQPTDGADPDHVTVDEAVIQLNTERYWLYAIVNPDTNRLLHVRLFSTRTQALTKMFLSELHEKHLVDDATFLVDGAPWLQAACHRLGLRFQYDTHGNRNAIERVFRELKRRTSSFSNTYSHIKPSTAENWLQAFAFAWNQLI